MNCANGRVPARATMRRRAPAEVLDLMRRGTANFARILNDLPDAALYEAVPRWPTRAHIVAMVGLQARAMCTALAALQRGENASGDIAWSVARSAIDVTASLPTRALRNLFAHSQVHLNVVLRDLRGEDWGIALESGGGPSWTIADIPHRRGHYPVAGCCGSGEWRSAWV